MSLFKKFTGREPDDELTVETMENREPPLSSSEHVPLTHRMAAKVTAFILVIFFAALSCLSVLAALVMIDAGVYITPEDEMREQYISSALDSCSNITARFAFGELPEEDAENYFKNKNVSGVSVFLGDEAAPDGNGADAPSRDNEDDVSQPVPVWTYGKGYDAPDQKGYKYTLYFYDGELYFHSDLDSQDGAVPVTVTVYVPNTLKVYDSIYFIDKLVTIAYSLRFAVYFIGIVSVLCSVSLFVFLMCASGRKAGYTAPQPGWGTWVPVDILTAGAGLAVFLLCSIIFESGYYLPDITFIFIACLCVLAIAVIFLGWCMSIALRLKTSGLWKSSAAYHALKLLRNGLLLLGSACRRFGRWLCSLLGAIPLVWKTALLFAAVTAADAFVIAFLWYDLDVYFIFRGIEKLILFPVLISLSLMLRKLQHSAKAMAEGDLSHKVDTSKMIFDIKKHGEYLNSINEGISVAVEQRTKSERMKTELITNVSHDIKTPLTSIINYSDLIEKEKCDNEKIKEYAAVLHRQSDRLKRLIDDLVEASKASTGNLDIQLSPCNVGVMLSQTAGEYEQRMKAAGLELITRQEKDPVFIMADGRRLWRVFDNLMGNICKYALSGTRVYLTLERRGEQAVISFKNTSREPLDLSAEELMERFVRGDSSRSSEGNGLGLSIAGSLTELQNGKLEITVDGDLFKAILYFPLMN